MLLPLSLPVLVNNFRLPRRCYYFYYKSPFIKRSDREIEREQPLIIFFSSISQLIFFCIVLLFVCERLKKTQMKRSPPTSSCSSSSSCLGYDFPHISEKPKAKRARKNHNPEKCLDANSPTSGRRSSIYRGVTRSLLSLSL